jgi:hypothetical protein
MKIDSIGAGTQNTTAIDALKTQQNQVQQQDKQPKPAQLNAPKDKVTFSPEALKAANEMQKGQ